MQDNSIMHTPICGWSLSIARPHAYSLSPQYIYPPPPLHPYTPLHPVPAQVILDGIRDVNLARFSGLADKVIATSKAFLRQHADKTKDLVSTLIQMERVRINHSHPDFAECQDIGALIMEIKAEEAAAQAAQPAARMTPSAGAAVGASAVDFEEVGGGGGISRGQVRSRGRGSCSTKSRPRRGACLRNLRGWRAT